MADPAKTAKKRTALPPSIVQKTPRYPTAENQTQSTKKLLVKPSTMREARMTTRATAMLLLGISTSLVRSSSSCPSDRVALGLATGRKETRIAAPPVVNLGRNVSPGHRTTAARVGHVILADGHRLKKRRRCVLARPRCGGHLIPIDPPAYEACSVVLVGCVT